MLLGTVRAWRSWKSAKSVALMCVLALAVGIGSTTAIFTVISSVMLRPLSYAHSDRMVTLFSATTTDPKHFGSNSVPDLLEYQSRVRAFEMFGWFQMSSFNLTSPGAPQHIDGVYLTPELARGTGIAPEIGQWFTDGSGAMISSALWHRLGGDRTILGKAIVLSGAHYTITGVMPSEFRLPIAGPYGDVQTDVWLYLDPAGRGGGVGEFCYARLRPGVTREQAEQEVKSVAAEIARRDPPNHPNYTARLDALQELLTRDVRPALLLLFGAAGLLLLITCANVAGLLLVRSVTRARETALQVALGAGTGQLARQYFIEGLVVSLAGALAGIGISVALVRIIVSIAASNIPRADEVALDGRALAFAIAAALVASALSSLAPLWHASRTQSNEVLADGVRSSAGARTRRLSRGLVVGEVALAATLLALSAALLDYLIRLQRTSPGFDPDHLLTFTLSIPDSILKNEGRRAAEEMALNRALEAIPGVTAAGSVNQLPLTGCCFSTRVYPEGGAANIDSTVQTSFMSISPGYFRTMRIPLRSGRLLEYQDVPKDIALVNVNYAAARYFWPERGDAVGAFGHFLSPTGSRFQVIGVVGDVRNNGLKEATVPEIYLLDTITAFNPWNFVVRSPRATESLLADVRRAVAGVDPQAPIHNVATMNEISEKSLQIERASSFMMGFFAVAALLMATLGVYGVVSYSVRQRTVEMGTRMALGAREGDILKLILGSGLRMAALGCVVGGVAIVAIAPKVAGWFQMDSLRVAPLTAGLAMVAMISIAATFFPAWRATLLAPASAIRNVPEPLWASLRQRILDSRRHSLRTFSQASAPETATLLTEFVDASRDSGSFHEAIESSLVRMCAHLGVARAVLVEKNLGATFRRTAANPPDLAPDLTLPAHSFLVNRLRFYDHAFPMSAGDFETWTRWAKENRPEHVAELEALEDAGVRMAVPLRTQKEMLGVLLLGPRADGERFHTSDKRLVRTAADQFALMLENARLTGRVVQQEVEQEKVRRDVELAIEVQQRLLPERPPTVDGATFAAFSLPARSVGGDYYDFVNVGEHRIGIALADVAGKGVAAALIMSVVQATLRIIASEGEISLPQLAARMNRYLHRSTKSNSYATFFYAQVEDGGRRLRYVNAGHNPPYLFRSADEIEELATGGAVIGLFPQLGFQEGAIDLRSGDVLVAFTDGVTEAMSPEEEEFGEERLKELVRDSLALAPQEIATRITEALRDWMQSAPQHDDLTLVVMKVS